VQQVMHFLRVACLDLFCQRKSLIPDVKEFLELLSWEALPKSFAGGKLKFVYEVHDLYS
jgi:hypothetical protein